MSKNNNSKNAPASDLAVVEQAPVALATVSDEEDVVDFGAYAGDVDKRTKDELVVERFRIVQALTKAKQENQDLRDGHLYGNISKKAVDSLLIAPIHETRSVVERKGENAGPKEKGQFVREYVETKPGSNDFGDARINALVTKAGGLKEIHKQATDNGNDIGAVYNVFAAFLDKETGTEITGFGVIVADKTNIRPYLKWRDDRVVGEKLVSVATYAFRTLVDGKGIYTNPNGQRTQQYQFRPFKDNNWVESLLRKKSVLDKLQAQKTLMSSGAIKVAEFSDADDSEDAQEAAAF